MAFLKILVCCLFISYCDRWPGVKLPCVFQTQPQAETGVGSSSSLPSVSAAAQTRGVNGFQGRAGSQQSTQGGCWAEAENNLRQRQSSEEINQYIDFPFFVCPCTHSLGDSTIVPTVATERDRAYDDLESPLFSSPAFPIAMVTLSLTVSGYLTLA